MIKQKLVMMVTIIKLKFPTQVFPSQKIEIVSLANSANAKRINKMSREVMLTT